MTEQAVKKDSRLRLNFSLAIESTGEMIDTNFDQPPVEMSMGQGLMLDAFEDALLGLKAGDEKSCVIKCADAFGSSNEDNVQRFKRSAFSEENLQKGLVVSFADKAGAELPGVVIEIGDMVTVDFNHPLADKDIVFVVKVHEVQS